MNYVAKTLLADPSGRYLLLRRSGTHPRYAYHLDLPGGEVDADELHLEAGAREIAEETGIMISPSNLHEVYRKQVTPTKTYLVLEGTLPAGDPDMTISWEHDEYYWLTPDELVTAERPVGMDDYMGTVLEYLENRQTLD